MSGPSRADVDAVLTEFRPGRSIYIQGGVGEPMALREILQASPDVLDGVKITSCLLPGMNEFDYAALHERASLTTFMLPAAMRDSFVAGRVVVRPMTYSQIAAYLSDQTFDLAIFQVSTPDEAGWCGFGPCADFPGLVVERARRRMAFVNSRLPRVSRGPRVRLGAMDVVIEAPGPFITARDQAPGAEVQAIAALVAEHVPDKAAIQTGIGAVPAAAIARLNHHVGLTVRSGMVTPGYEDLERAGAFKEGAAHITGMAIGPEAFMHWASGAFTFADALTTHGAEGLAATPRFTAINSALEIDLFGQVNLEWRDGRLFGGVGGAPDFARAARRSVGGRAILAFPSIARNGAVSRIVSRLAGPTISLARDDADLIITEHGVADLRGADLDRRAERLIAIAAPAHREGLARAWRVMQPF